MAENTAANLRKTIVEIDRQILEILLPHRSHDHAEMQKVATLEHARNAAQRLLLAAESDESKAGA